MRKILSLFAAILFAGSMMAEVGSLYYTFLPYKPAKNGVSDYTKTGTMTIDEMDWTVPGNWYATGGLRLGGKSLDGVDRTIIGQDAMGSAIAKIRIAHAGVTADKIVLNSITVTTASDADFTQNVTTKTVTGFTVAKNAKDTIDVVPTTEPWAINSYYKIAFNLTNSQASNYSFVVESILFYAYVAGGDPDPDPQPTTNTLYLKAGTVNYAVDNATVAAWAWETGQDGAWYTFAATETEGVSSIAIPTACNNVKIMRWPASTTPSWDAESSAWNKTGDIALPATFPATTDMLELTAWDGATSGTWSKYEAGSTPEPPVSSDEYTVVGAKALIGADWDLKNADALMVKQDDGTYMLTINEVTLSADTEYRWKVATNHAWGSGEYPASGDYILTVDKDGKYKVEFTLTVGTGATAKTTFIEDAVVTHEYTVLGDPLLFGEDHKWDLNNAATLMVKQDDGSYKCSIAEVSLTAGDYAWKVATDHAWGSGEYPSSGDYTLKIEKSGKYKVDFTLVLGTGATATATLLEEEADPKFFITGTAALVGEELAWNPKAIASLEDSYDFENLPAGDYMLKITVDGSWETTKGYDALTTVADGITRGKQEDNNDDNICFTLAEAGKVTVFYDGKDFYLTGKFYVAPVAKFYITGNKALVGEELEWKPNAIRSDETSYKLNLKAGVDYMLKITINGTWEGENNVKGFDALTTTAKGLVRGTGDDDDNICFKLNADGEVNVHYDGEYFFLNGDFYVAPDETKYFLKNNWNGAEEWSWKEMIKEDGGYYSLANVVFGGQGVNINTAADDEGAKWIAVEDIEAFDAEYEPAVIGALDTVVFFFDPQLVSAFTGANGLSAMIISKYVAPVPAKFYITGNAALVGEELEWQPNAIRSDETSYKLNLKAGVDYMLKITVNGTWEGENNVKGFDALTTVAKGLVRGEGENDDNICFKLNADGEVNVHYDGEYFFLNGDFYVAPDDTKYFLKNNWNGAEEWSWKEMTKNEETGYYELENVVFGGQGVNINTAADDEGAKWAAAEDIPTLDLVTFEMGTLEALDTVAFVFDPEAVNSLTGESGISAYIISKYVAPVPAKFYITGNEALVGEELEWQPNAIRSDETSYKLNLKAGVDYMLKITINGTWEGENNVKGFDALTTVAKGLVRGEGENDDNICFKLNADGEVNVHYDGEYFFLNGDFYVAPVEVKYFLKNNWNGAEEWSWKEMIQEEDGYYSLANVVFGGQGVNINTAADDEGAKWIAVEDIEAFDAEYEPAVIGALDTVVFFFEPEQVNAFTGANGLSAKIIGKYVAPETPELADGFYLVGTMNNWGPAEGYLFAENAEVPGEYMLTTTLAENDELKVAKVVNEAIETWYLDDNYVVPAQLAGVVNIYFKPNYEEAWAEFGGYIYIEKSQGTGLEHLAVEGKAVKAILNGQLFILRGGKTYTVQGQVVR